MRRTLECAAYVLIITFATAVGLVLDAILFGATPLVPCSKHQGELCPQKKECVLNCKICTEKEDKC